MFPAKEISTSGLLDERSAIKSAIIDHWNISNRLFHLFIYLLFIYYFIYIKSKRIREYFL